MNTKAEKHHSRQTALLIATLLGLIGATIARGGEPTLKVGDAAPKLMASKWVQGDPVKEFERGKVYVIEFWATWCGPCLVSIPHLNELHTKFKNRGVIVIGQDVLENDQSLVAPFVKKMGEQMTYPVALDTVSESQTGKMAETWMDAAGETGIPTAFVLDQRARIAWIGHPAELQESLLEEILSGNFDLKKAAREHEDRRKKDEQMRTLLSAFQTHTQREEWPQAEAVLAQMDKLLSEDERHLVAMKRFGLLLDRKDYKAAYKLAEQLSDQHRDNALLQNELAWDIATREGIEDRDLNLAEKVARRADEAAKGRDPEILDTLGRILFLRSQKETAVELQEKAVQLAKGRRKEQFQQTLDSYKAGKLPKPY